MTQLTQPLTQLFQRHRIVFWYDAKSELRADWEALELPGVTKVEIANNQFGLKHRLLRAEAGNKFLVYHDGPPPPDAENWLLDVQLASGSFSADQTALWLREVGLDPIQFAPLAAAHIDFFKAASRRAALGIQLQSGEHTERTVRQKMLSVCAGVDGQVPEILEQLLLELSQEKDDTYRLIQRSALDDFLWQQLGDLYGYDSSAPGVVDFALTLFKSAYAAALTEDATLTDEAHIFLRRWKNGRTNQAAFETLSARFARDLNIEPDLLQRSYTQLSKIDLFELIDRKILSELIRVVENRTLGAAACAAIVRDRRQGHWYARYAHNYQAILAGSEFLALLDQVALTPTSFVDGIRQYATSWYKLDQHYRHCVYHIQESGQPTLHAPLLARVENHYINNFLRLLNDRWQQHVDALSQWDAQPIPAQRDVYRDHVRPVLDRNNKLYVIISDALRYEAAEELLHRIRQENRYDAELSPALASLPSHTKLGMAALLPHRELRYTDDGHSVLADGQSTQGTQARSKILADANRSAGTAIQAKDLLNMSRDESRALTREHDVIYVYHNRIDAVGDTRDTEYRTFREVEAALDELVLVIKKLANANAYNILITADHGFIYQHRELEESDFASQAAEGHEILDRSRRYVLGHGLHADAGFKHFTAAQVGLAGDIEILIPKSINRLRVQGAGSHYVHGGASLQEIIIPLLSVNISRVSDIRQVRVDVIRGTNTIISTNQLTVVFYQTEPVSAKVQPLEARAGLYATDGTLISDPHEVIFDRTAADPRDREIRVRFNLARAADAFNGQDVVLRLDTRTADTTHYKENVVAHYQLIRAFTVDFE